MKNLKLPNALKRWASALLLLCCVSSIASSQSVTIKRGQSELEVTFTVTEGSPTCSGGTLSGPINGIYTVSCTSHQGLYALIINGDFNTMKIGKDIYNGWLSEVTFTECSNLQSLTIADSWLSFTNVKGMPTSCTVTENYKYTVPYLCSEAKTINNVIALEYGIPFGSQNGDPAYPPCLAAQIKAGGILTITAGANTLVENIDYTVNPTTKMVAILPQAVSKIGTSKIKVTVNHPVCNWTLSREFAMAMESFTITPGAKKDISLRALSTDGTPVFVDWGNGILKESVSYDYFNLKGVVTGSIVTFYAKSFREIVIDGQDISAIDIKNCKNLMELNCSRNKLTQLITKYSPSLTWLFCVQNELESIDVSTNRKLTILQCSENKLKSLNVMNNNELQVLYCNNNKLETIDLSRNSNLLDLRCSYNLFKTISVENLTKLTAFNCSNNNIEELNISSLILLTYLDCSYNKLTAFDFSQNVNLVKNDFYFNDITFKNLKGELKPDHRWFQNPMQIQSSINVGEQIDLSEFGATEYKWERKGYSGEFYTDFNQVGDIFSFPTRRSMNCTMTNSNFPGMRLWTTYIDILDPSLKSSQETELTTVAENEVATATVAVLPNPAQNSIIVSGLEGASLQIVSYTGTVVRDILVYDGGSIDISNLKSGLYTVVSGGNEVRFVKE